jgi:putative transposase
MLGDRGQRVRFLLHDRDTKFTRSFDDVVRSEGAQILLTPAQAPNANAYAERWIRTVRAECLDWLLILGRGHLQQSSVSTSSTTTPTGRTGALRLEPPVAPANPTIISEQQRRVRRRDRLGGLFHEYHRQAA